MHFVETPIFTSAIAGLMSDEEYRALQTALLLRPGLGSVIPASGGLRKLRWVGIGRGKRGGTRVIYYWFVDDATIYLLYAYAKTATADLTAGQLKALRRIVLEEFE